MRMLLINIWISVFLLGSLQVASAQEMPHPFAVAAKSAALIDGDSGQFLYGQNPDERISPASFVKLLTLFLVFDAIDQGQVLLEDKVWISKKAWRTGGSKMFVRQGNRVPLVELIKGIAVVSGNDACVAVAEFLQGNEQAFVEKMSGVQSCRLCRQGANRSHLVHLSGCQQGHHGAHAVAGQTHPRDPMSRHEGGRRLHFGDLFGIGGLRETSFTLTVSGKVKAEYFETPGHQGRAHITQDPGMSGAGKTVTKNDTTPGSLCWRMIGARQLFSKTVWKLNLLLQGYPLSSELRY